MTQPKDDDGNPQVTIGGKLWSVPQLAARQNKIIDPLILGLLPVFAKWQTDRARALSLITAEQYEHLQEIAFQALRRASPELTRDQFLDLPVTLSELVAAFSIIAQQTGVFTKGDGSQGEAQPQTGTL